MAGLRYVALLSVSIFSALVTAQETGLDTCTEVHVFFSRGNNEPYPGRQGKLIQAICSGLTSCDYEDIVFNNALQTEYCGAVEAGRKAGIEQITAYNKRCPDTKLVVSGYSQGAQVLGDILGGGGGVFFQGCTTPTVPGLDPKSAPGNMSASINGLFPRSGRQLAGLHNFARVLRDWCQGDDPICASGDGKRAYNVQHHLNYFDVYPGAAGQWVRSKLGEVTSPTSSSATASSTISMSTAMSETSTTSIAITATSSADLSSTLTSSLPGNSGSTTSTGTSALLPDATDSSPSASLPPTSGSQEGGAEIIRSFASRISLVALILFIFVAT
ncbi:carbohydrate esterase family 5 protein [Hypoxylon sp. NC0597]|nr:carbohydrate esterase family 5 protein [Hypoxylon sp. NC0597]